MFADIKRQFAEVISHSQGIQNPELDELFDQWATAKKKFIDRFGGLTYEWSEPVEFVLDEVERNSRASEFIDYVCDAYRNYELARFVGKNLNSLYDNKVVDSCGKNIPQGMKLIKAFKYFEKNKDTLREMQDAASVLIQQQSIKGTLCFSVHPLDFLSSSENTYNWRSCHALDGEYRAGNLSYMVDECTFMVYLKGADNVKLDAFGSVKWNSKKWRMLLHVSTDDKIMFAGRQYPFVSTSGLDTVLNIYNNLLEWKDKYAPWHQDYITTYTSNKLSFPIDLDHRYFMVDRTLLDIEDVVKSGEYAMNYNDILNSTCYTKPFYTTQYRPFGWNVKNLRDPGIRIGAAVNCLHCGGDYIRNPETMRCDACEIEFGYEENDVYGSCSCCNGRICYDDSYYVGDDDEPVCPNCFKKYCFTCQRCGGLYFTDTDCMSIEVAEDEYEYVCPHCYRNYEENKGEN